MSTSDDVAQNVNTIRFPGVTDDINLNLGDYSTSETSGTAEAVIGDPTV